MVKKGKLTTVISDAALIIGAVYTSGQLSGDMLIQAIVLIGGVSVAILDAYFPETVDKIESALPDESEPELQ